ncbi:electron transfer flavoprotein, beta subunit [Saccharomonospora marina XMU15]|uniref:Electron transfer flavoprotein small subunit n=1 Tax=Saccharomonospora marina XMU15 TaxID=882083 RepID=H5WXF0_9PSEU|nr:mycofactocin-associated electron transfer flavoprotein beta subunit [Saccharomonospora marina]EHR49479.1 electron transfer flavoprotein, beta subunit [Saccharomonospora marina XMU15]
MADHGSGPLVVVAMRWVDSHARVDALTGRVSTDARGAGPGEADRCALEHGLRIARAVAGRCVAVSLAPEPATEMLRDALACGAHAVLRVDPGHATGAEHTGNGADSGATTAQALARAVREELGHPDLVLTGDRSADRGTGATPAFLAAELGCAQALGLVELSYTGGRLVGLRRLDRGRRERLAIPLPAVCSVEPAGVRLRRANLRATLAARTATIPVVPSDPTALAAPPVAVRSVRPYRPRAKELPPPQGADPRQRLLRLTGAHEQREPPRVVVTDDAGRAADELLNYLRGKGYLA